MRLFFSQVAVCGADPVRPRRDTEPQDHHRSRHPAHILRQDQFSHRHLPIPLPKPTARPHFQSRRIAAWPCGSPDEERALVDREDPAAGAFSVPIESKRKALVLSLSRSRAFHMRTGTDPLYPVPGRLSLENGSATLPIAEIACGDASLSKSSSCMCIRHTPVLSRLKRSSR